MRWIVSAILVTCLFGMGVRLAVIVGNAVLLRAPANLAEVFGLVILVVIAQNILRALWPDMQ